MIPIRYQEDEPRVKELDRTLADDHPLVGKLCPACDHPLLAGEKVALVYVGPGDSPGAQAAARRGQYHVGSAVALHPACAGCE